MLYREFPEILSNKTFLSYINLGEPNFSATTNIIKKNFDELLAPENEVNEFCMKYNTTLKDQGFHPIYDWRDYMKRIPRYLKRDFDNFKKMLE
jgi:predicted esterase YcpF (UPF0227 family)